MILLDPITNRDFSRGRIAKSAVATSLSPQNSVSNSINVDYSEVIGSGVVRKGRQSLSTIVTSTTTGQSSTSVVLTDEAAFDATNWQAQMFTPVATHDLFPVAINVKLYRVGAANGNMTLSLQTVSGGNPTGTVVQGNTLSLDTANIATSTSGTVYTFLLNPGTFLSPSVQYAIVLKYAGGSIGGGQYIMWMRDSAASVTGANIKSTTNSGSTWSGQSGDFYFVEIVNDLAGTYSRAPMGNFSFLVANVAKNVVAFRSDITNQVVVFYYNTTAGAWYVSSLQNLTYLKRVRFVVMNGYVFEANGSEAMHSSADFGATWGTTNAITTDGVIPSLLIVAKNRMLASGFSTYPSRVYFSSLVDPSASPFISWNTDPSTGDWIDINPDDGGVVTGFSNTSNLTLIFKNNAMYRLSTVARSVDTENIFNVGAVSQEAITSCLGLTYFYSGNGIYQTDGTFPVQISRLGVQDFIDAITSSFGSNLPTEVYAWNDGFNVYFSIGTVTITFGPEDTRTYSNVVLKFSVRDQSWQVFTHNVQLAQTSQFGTVQGGITVLSQQYNGKISNSNSSTISDDGAAIPYDLETQELEFGNRSHTKQISDQLVVYTRNGTDGMFLIKQNDGNFESCNIQLDQRVNVGDNINFEADFFTFRWQGEALNVRPIFEGYHLPKVTDLGVIKSQQ